VRIPAGVDNGSRLRLTGEGEAGANGGPHGDLYVFIHAEGHDFFKRDDTSVLCQIPVSFVQATLGDTISIPTLDGETDLEIPKGTQPGDIFRLRGQGIPSLRNGHRGDQIVQVNVKTPTNLNKKTGGPAQGIRQARRGQIHQQTEKHLKKRSDPGGELGRFRKMNTPIFYETTESAFKRQNKNSGVRIHVRA
jgi:molecular chaperone DnaJ